MTKLTINDIALTVGSGITPLRSNASFWDNPKFPWLKTEQLGEFQIFDTTEYISQTALEQTNIKLWPKNTVSVAMYGEGKTRGNTSIIMREMATNQACCNVIVKTEVADFRFLYYWIKNNYEQLRVLSSGVRKNLNSDDIKGFPFPDTKLHVQKKIADILYAIDLKILNNNCIIVELEAMVKTIYDYWFVQFDFPNAEGKPYRSSGGKMIWNEELKMEIPEDWVVDKINNTITVKDGTHDSPKAQKKGHPLITSKHLLERGIDFDNANLISEDDYIAINRRSKVDSGDILFSMIGTVGTVYKVEEENINFAIKNVALYKTSQKYDYKNYIYMYLRSCFMQVYMSNVLSGSIQNFIGLGDLRNMPLLISDTYIREFDKKTKKIFEKINNCKEQNQELSRIRDWLLPMLLKGQVRVE